MVRAFAWSVVGVETVASWVSFAVICLLGLWLFYAVARGVVTAVSENWIGSAMILAGSLVGAFAFPALQKLYSLARRLADKTLMKEPTISLARKPHIQHPVNAEKTPKKTNHANDH